MTFGIFSFIVTIIIFAGTAVLIEWTLAFKRLKKYVKIIGVVATLGFIGTAIAESVALNWRTWYYSQGKTFGIYFGAAAENLIYIIFVAVAVASATLIWSDYEQDGKPLLKTTVEQIQDKFRKWLRMKK